MDLPEGFVKEMAEELAAMSGLVLWRVTGTWASSGRTGTIDDVVSAKDAISAMRRAWEPEDVRQLRTISAEWLCPVELVKKTAVED